MPETVTVDKDKLDELRAALEDHHGAHEAADLDRTYARIARAAEALCPLLKLSEIVDLKGLEVNDD